MNWEQVARRWSEMRENIKSRWPKLTNDDLAEVGGSKEVLVAKIEQRYGLLEDEAIVQVNEWLEKSSPAAALNPFREAILGAVALVVVVAASFGLGPLPLTPVRYVCLALMVLALMAILFRRWRRLEF
jgi:uncharacterized protein YjbJ (UPF0337 family)